MPQRREFLRAHSGDAGELVEGFRAVRDGRLDGVHRLRHGGAARFGFDADTRHGRGECEDSRFADARQRSGGREARCHLGDFLLGRGEIVAEVDNGRAKAAVLVRARTRDVREPGERCRCLVRRHVGRRAELHHCLREIEQGLLLDAKLSGGFRDGGNFLRRRGDFRRQRADRVRHGGELLVGEIRCLCDAGDGRLKVHGGLRAIHEILINLTQPRDNPRRGERLVNLRQRLARLAPEALRSLRCLLLFLFESVNFPRQRGGACAEIVHVGAGLLKRFLQVGQPLFLFFQRGVCAVNRHLLREQLVFERGGERPRLLDLALNVVILLLQPGKLRGRRLHALLLLLVGGDVLLLLLQLLNPLCDIFELLLRFPKSFGVARIGFRAEPEQHLIFLCHSVSSPPFQSVPQGFPPFFCVPFQAVVFFRPPPQQCKRNGKPERHGRGVVARQNKTLPPQPRPAVPGFYSALSKKERAFPSMRM